MKRKAVVLLSGGLDSATTLFLAISKGYDCQCLIFDYGQRHRKEIEQARRIAELAEVRYKSVRLGFPWKASSLVDKNEDLPLARSIDEITKGIPTTYVPARNTIFLSVAASFAEAIGASDIFIGAHHEDSSGYPDCRKAYIDAYNKAIGLGTKGRVTVRAPLISKSKKDIIRMGRNLNVPFHLTWSCYKGQANPCGECDACVLRAKGFAEAGLNDPLENSVCSGHRRRIS